MSIMLSDEEFKKLQADSIECARLTALINTPELVDFIKAVPLEAAHQIERWGGDGDQGKSPADWFWLLSHLSSRALEHHKEGLRLTEVILGSYPAFIPGEQTGGCPQYVVDQVAHHREKAAHHCITSAAALSLWHAHVIGRHTAMRPGTGVDHGI